ncbi:MULTISPECIES: hypothetical protein [unclassified Variovorax]|uniref:glycine-rich domain-containing protein n=1 Tax=unclassified Variovorax TaxID=663243 RepID=UPI00076D6C38|nr:MULTISPECIES: hypothetical protein [unclassified Variovorax]KWT89365.1 PE-PGRS family protein [Variovorax sp. WDL1]PNG56541.1 hypothetical protein CHC07_02960 [Variovorax sp. B4]PNG57965.1 hypothetical protein CHC06_02963 [Variovorax sp. B2]VTV09563.1 hypothetical protein WDL1CHR_00663 [Variovorax sp. WDL1]
MFGIDDPTAVAVMPTPEAAGTVGFWTEGNPGLGQAATLMRASFFNGLQQELLNILSAGGVTPSKTTYNQLTTALTNLFNKGRLIGLRVITSTGTYTPTAGTNSVVVTVIGGGGGGGGSQATAAGQCAAGGGGGGGGWARKRITSSFSGVTVTIGAGGAGGVIAAGSAGGTTSFGALVSATGGGAGPLGTAASSATVAANGVAGGGVGSSGDVNGQGGIGMYALYAVNPTSGKGGFSYLGEGAAYVTGGYLSGNAGPSLGSGGSGSAAQASNSGATGGAGAAGVCIIEEYA